MNTVLRKSRIHERGIFASEDIHKGEVIEICPIIFLGWDDTKKMDDTQLYDYYFSWKGGSGIALGYGSIYNHSYRPNAAYEKLFSRKQIVFMALKRIKKGEEITVNYNGNPKSTKRVWFEKNFHKLY